ncbi:DUF4037 domain-containing protein [Kribbella qitaiheensis]|uniref:DUF4037 domain-containing protein n=2 Tax=Kribbella qitaiheensis TaxID=1544730 RepID=A0A7G6XAP0_9ACTN|nr:DUF4037 domain-containing protein [Kribbella qitaiheensis]
MAKGFISARELSAGFHDDVIRPLLGEIPYAAGLLGWGSDVLGYDTERSTDHGWGPRLQVLVDATEVERVRELIDGHLPTQYRGHDVRFGWDAQEPVNHIGVKTVGDWLTGQLGRDVGDGMTTEDWLVTPQQELLGVVAGPVYADDGRLQRVREALTWYPDEVWRWLLACQWTRIAQEEAFVQRTAEVGDDLGSRIVAARLTRDLMRLALLMARTYAPYMKWLGTAFARLGHPDGLDRDLADVLNAATSKEREEALTTAYEKVARRHNELGITEYVDPTPRPYFDRPAMVLAAGRFTEACLATVEDPWLRGLELVGSIDQFTDSTDLLSNPAAYRRLATMYRK